MQTIKLETSISAPAMRVFLLSLSVDLHTESTVATNEKAIAGVTHGLMKIDDVVTWRARHFGVMLKHTSKITQYSAPDFFEDSMTSGAFKSFVHTHQFQPDMQGTRMHDVLFFASPLGPLGAAVDHFVLRRYLARFLQTRNDLIRTVAESDRWTSFIPDSLQARCL